MIENTVNIIGGIKNGYDISEVIGNSSPLGYFPEMKSIRVIDPDDFSKLY